MIIHSSGLRRGRSPMRQAKSCADAAHGYRHEEAHGAKPFNRVRTPPGARCVFATQLFEDAPDRVAQALAEAYANGLLEIRNA